MKLLRNLPGEFSRLGSLIKRVPTEFSLLPFSKLDENLIGEIRQYSKEGQLFSCNEQGKDLWLLDSDGNATATDCMDINSPIGYTFVLVAKSKKL